MILVRSSRFHQENTGNVVLDPSVGSQGHSLRGGCIATSSHHKWIATGGPDGQLILRAIGAIVSTCFVEKLDIVIEKSE